MTNWRKCCNINLKGKFAEAIYEMENKKIYIHANITEMSKKIEKTLRSKLVKSGLRVFEELTDDTELIASAVTALCYISCRKTIFQAHRL